MAEFPQFSAPQAKGIVPTGQFSAPSAKATANPFQALGQGSMGQGSMANPLQALGQGQMSPTDLLQMIMQHLSHLTPVGGPAPNQPRFLGPPVPAPNMGQGSQSGLDFSGIQPPALGRFPQPIQQTFPRPWGPGGPSDQISHASDAPFSASQPSVMGPTGGIGQQENQQQAVAQQLARAMQMFGGQQGEAGQDGQSLDQQLASTMQTLGGQNQLGQQGQVGQQGAQGGLGAPPAVQSAQGQAGFQGQDQQGQNPIHAMLRQWIDGMHSQNMQQQGEQEQRRQQMLRTFARPARPAKPAKARAQVRGANADQGQDEDEEN